MSADKASLWAYYWRILAPDMAEMTPEYPFSKCVGRKHRFDWADVNSRVAVEIDGGNHMVKNSRKTGRAVAVGRHTQETDYEKLNLAASLRWLVFRFSPAQLNRDPEKCVGMVKQAIMDNL